MMDEKGEESCKTWDSGSEDFQCAMFMETAWFQSEDRVKA